MLQIGLLLLVCAQATAASDDYLAIESVFGNPPPASRVQTYAIVIASSRTRFSTLSPQVQLTLQEYFVYQTRVTVGSKIFYRLAVGNFISSKSAQIALQRLQQGFPVAWIYRRSPPEIEKLADFLGNLAPVPTEITTPTPTEITIPTPTEIAIPTPSKKEVKADKTEQLLASARQEFIDANYARVVAITDKVIVTGNLNQVREALELAGITRERQGQFAQAIILYEALLDTQPEKDVSSRIEARLEGIRTMSLAPKALIDKKEEQAGAWNYRGILQQFYQDDVVDRSDEEADSVNRFLITDIDLHIQKTTDTDKLEFRIDAGLVNDFLEDSSDNRISNANVGYTNDDFRLIGGRQTRTLTGVYDRFDGITYSHLSFSDYQLSIGYGNLVESTFDGVESDRPVVGANLDFSPYPWLDLGFYAVHQEIFDLTDRQAIGSEVKFQNETGFVYSIIDYDVFYEKLGNLSIISNYQYDQKLSFNMTLNKGYSPILATINALQGQTATTIDELKDTFTRDEIYQLAEDRTSKSLSIFLGANYLLDANRQIYINFSSLKLDSTKASGGVERIPSSTDFQLAIDYSFQGLLFQRDYATLGTTLSDSPTSEGISIRVRTRFTGYQGISFDPRIQLQYRQDKDDGFDQWILNPSLKLKYRVTKKLSFEGSFEIEHSEIDLPEIDKQTIYSLFVGYFYLF